jgi:PKD repeat protein
VFDGSGLSATEEIQVVVLDTEGPVADAGLDQEIKLDGKATFDGTNSTDNVDVESWVWTFNYNQALEELEGPQASFTFELQGTYTITLTVTDHAGNTATDTVSVTVTADPEVGGPGGDIGGIDAMWFVLGLVAIIIVLILVVVLRGRPEKPEKSDLGWAPTEEEKKSRDPISSEGEKDDDAGDGDGEPTDN